MVPAVTTPATERTVHFVELCPECDRPLDVEAVLTARGILVSIGPCAGCRFDAGLAEYDLARTRAALLFIDGVA